MATLIEQYDLSGTAKMPPGYTENLENINISKKREYEQPQLHCYGALRNLTQSGTGAKKEGPGAGNSGPDRQKVAASDLNAKENIVQIGVHPLGISLYLFDYKPEFRDTWGHGRQFGVIAQEAETVMPEAVSTHPDGYKMVDYAMLGITRSIQ
jgi:hypothetical protein